MSDQYLVFDDVSCSGGNKSVLDLAEKAMRAMNKAILSEDDYALVSGMVHHVQNDGTTGGTEFYAGVLGNVAAESDAANEDVAKWITENIKEVILRASRTGSCSVYIGEGGLSIDPASAFQDERGLTLVRELGEYKALESRATLILNPVVVHLGSGSDRAVFAGLPSYMGGLLSFVRSNLLANSSIEAKAELSKVRVITYNEGMSGNPESIGGMLEGASNSSSRQIESKDGSVYSVSGGKDEVDIKDAMVVSAPIDDSLHYLGAGMVSGPVSLQVAGGAVGEINRDILDVMTSSAVSGIASDWPKVVQFCGRIVTMWQELNGVTGDVVVRRTLHASEYAAVGRLMERLAGTIFTVNELRGIAGQMLGIDLPDLDDGGHRT